MLSKEEIEKAYWKGYIAKQNEAMEICKQCKYIKKVKQLESDKQKLIEKLVEDIDELETLNDNYTDADILEGIYTTRGQIIKANEILSILKGENHDNQARIYRDYK